MFAFLSAIAVPLALFLFPADADTFYVDDYDSHMAMCANPDWVAESDRLSCEADAAAAWIAK